MKIGIIGAGAIGTFLLEKINKEYVIPGTTITALFDPRKKTNSKLKTISDKYQAKIYNDLDDFLSSSTSLIIECATIDVVQEYAREIIRYKDLFLISVGALADKGLTQDLHNITVQMGRKLYLPTGAIGGLDVLRAANVLDGLESVKLITRKPAHAFDEDVLTKPKTIFSGSAQEAIVNYPKNTNISIIISLAGIGSEKTQVEIIADPTVHKNVHQLKARGSFGKLNLTLENNVSPSNPRTSYLTALSILSSLKSLDQSLVIG